MTTAPQLCDLSSVNSMTTTLVTLINSTYRSIWSYCSFSLPLVAGQVFEVYGVLPLRHIHDCKCFHCCKISSIFQLSVIEFYERFPRKTFPSINDYVTQKSTTTSAENDTFIRISWVLKDILLKIYSETNRSKTLRLIDIFFDLFRTNVIL